MNYWIVLLVIIAVIALIVWYCNRSRYLREASHRTRQCCWYVHTTLPCLRIFPSEATDAHSMFQNNPAHNSGPGSDLAAEVIVQNVVESETSATTYNVPSYNPGPVTAPPPTYDEVTTSSAGARGRTSGSWFIKLSR